MCARPFLSASDGFELTAFSSHACQMKSNVKIVVLNSTSEFHFGGRHASVKAFLLSNIDLMYYSNNKGERATNDRIVTIRSASA